jgi:hypothetical protein
MSSKRISILGLQEQFDPEATSMTDELLEFVFIPTNTYQSTISPKKILLFLVGNKGTGKSTVIQKILHESSGVVIKILFRNSSINKKILSHSVDKKDKPIEYVYNDDWYLELWISLIKEIYSRHK